MRSSAVPILALLATLCVGPFCVGQGSAFAAKAPAPQADVAESMDAVCGDFLNLDKQLHDYRMRNSDAFLNWSVADIKRNHYDLAMNNMRQGSYSQNVAADLHFMLRGWPNHYPALEARIQYDLHKGHQYEFPSTECYFERARRAFADDANVVLLEGYYFWKTGNRPRARKIYEEALRLDPESVDAHYNLGLVCLEMSDLDEAVKHAEVAYAAGYPLPGLRTKLEKAGRWPPPSASATP